MSAWTHAICVECWNARHPDRKTTGRGVGAPLACCFCARETSDGIYVREDPANIHCGGLGAVHENRTRVRVERKHASGDPHPSDVERLDGVALGAWLHATARADFAADPTGGGVNLTRVHSYGRQTAWPGDPDDVAAWLNANGFACRMRRAEGSMETFVEVTGPAESPAPDWPRGVVQAMNAAALSRPDLAWVLRRFTPGQRVCAQAEIIYGTGQRVEEGSYGTVVRMEDGGTPVVRVLWDTLADGEPYELGTSCEFVDGARDPHGDPA